MAGKDRQADRERMAGGLSGTPGRPTPGTPAAARADRQAMPGIIVLNRGLLDFTDAEIAQLRADYRDVREEAAQRTRETLSRHVDSIPPEV